MSSFLRGIFQRYKKHDKILQFKIILKKFRHIYHEIFREYPYNRVHQINTQNITT